MPKIGPKWPYSKGMAKGHAFLMDEQAHASLGKVKTLLKGQQQVAAAYRS